MDTELKQYVLTLSSDCYHTPPKMLEHKEGGWTPHADAQAQIQALTATKHAAEQCLFALAEAWRTCVGDGTAKITPEGITSLVEDYQSEVAALQQREKVVEENLRLKRAMCGHCYIAWQAALDFTRQRKREIAECEAALEEVCNWGNSYNERGYGSKECDYLHNLVAAKLATLKQGMKGVEDGH
jgi:hypothetical protein